MILGGPGFGLLLAAIGLTIWAQFKVKSTYSRYLKVPSQRGITGAEAASELLRASGLHDVGIEMIPGQLTDHYDPRDRTLRLSQANFHGTSISAIGVSAHEAGHALQHAANYAPLNIRMAVVPLTSFGSQALIPAAIFGLLIFRNPIFIDLAIIGYGILLAFQLVTLPVEFDATRRAKDRLMELGLVTGEEQRGVSSVLSAAAWTYVAAMIVALVNLIRLFLLRGRD